MSRDLNTSLAAIDAAVINFPLEAEASAAGQRRADAGAVVRGKPKGMRWQTFCRLSAQHNIFVNESLAGAMRRLGIKIEI